MAESVFIAIDIGGTWLKAAAFESPGIASGGESFPEVSREPSRLGKCSAPAFAERIIALVSYVAEGRTIAAIGISCPGLVDPQGSDITLCAAHLSPLDDSSWIDQVRARFQVSCTLMNDAQAGLCGAAQSGLLPRSGTVGFMPVGTGLGFVIWKNGKLWNPSRTLPLLGCIMTPAGTYDQIASATRLAIGHPSGELAPWLLDPLAAEERSTYFSNLAGIIATATTLYQLDSVIIAGGLAAAAHAVNFQLVDSLEEAGIFPTGVSAPVLIAARTGNNLNLLGAAALASGESRVVPLRKRVFARPTTESPLNNELRLEKIHTAELLTLLHMEELSAAERLGKSLELIAPIVDAIAADMEAGGRIIYVGAGTSGRLAALDAVELPCTFGCALGQAIALIAGGTPEALDTIETGGEEDCSSVPDLLLVQLGPLDTVIGISASGTSYFVRSALEFAKANGCRAILIQEAPAHPEDDGIEVISLRSGPEILQGSTRMKAGTATKRLLNAITTVVMIRRGKVRGTSMIDLHCLNEKLRSRAVGILHDLHGLDEETSRGLLTEAGWNLRQVIDALDS